MVRRRCGQVARGLYRSSPLECVNIDLAVNAPWLTVRQHDGVFIFRIHVSDGYVTPEQHVSQFLHDVAATVALVTTVTGRRPAKRASPLNIHVTIMSSSSLFYHLHGMPWTASRLSPLRVLWLCSPWPSSASFAST